MKKQTKQKWLMALLMLGFLWMNGQTSCTVNPCISNPPPSCEYVCNGSFSLCNTPPTGPTHPGGFQQITKACGWSSTYPATTPDYYHSAALLSDSVQIPCNANGIQGINIDEGYAGLFTSNQPHWKEAIRTNLKTTLTLGSFYEVSFYLSLSDGTANFNALNSFGFDFGTVPIYVNTSSVTSTGWTKIVYIYLAIGTESTLDIGFLTTPALGDLLSTGNFTTFNCFNSVPNGQNVYYYLDNVSVREIFPIQATSSSSTGCTGESFTLSASGASTYTWQPGNLTGSSVVVTPTAATIYTLTGSTTGGCATTTETIGIYPASCCTNTNSGAIHLRNVTLMASSTSSTIARPWSTLTTGGFYSGNIAVPANGVITNTLSVIGGLTVNTPVTFSLCNIFFTEDAPLTQNYAMKIDRSWFRGCNKMWEGIVSKATLTVTNSFIEDAFMGINGGAWFLLTTHPGINVDNTVFLKNWAGIAVGTCSMNPSNFKITGSVFTSRNVSDALHNFAVNTQYNSTLLPLSGKIPARMLGSTAHGIPVNTQRSNIGIYVPTLITNTNTVMFTIGAAGADQAATDKLANMFDYMNCGIYNNNSKFYIYNCKFSNMINTGYGNAIGAIHHNDGANNDKNTITIVGGNGSSYYKNVFGFGATTQILDAVNAYNGGQVEVRYNDFKNITRYGVSIQNWAVPTASLVAYEPVNVANNSYTNAAYAFYAYNNQGITATVTANTVTNTTTTYTNNANVYIDDVGKSANSTFYVNNNVLKTSLNGVYARNAQNVRVVDNTIEVAKPTSTSIYNGAVWFDNVDNGFVKNNIISCNPTNANSWNTYGVFANASTNNKYKCNTITKVSACMKFQSNCAPTYNYNNSLNNTGGTDPCYFGIWLDNTGQTGNVGNLNGSAWEAADIFWGDFSIADTKAQASSNYPFQATIHYNAALMPIADYRPLVNINTYGGIDFSQSYSVTSASPLSQNTCDEQARFVGQTGVVKGGLSNNNADDGSNEPVLRKQLLLPVVQSNSNSNTTSKVIKGVNEAYFYIVDSLIATYVATKNVGALTNAKNINASIVATTNQEQNQKDLNDIYCVFVEDDSLVTTNQINYLHNLALMCPFTEGLSVYEARGLMRTWDDSTFYYNSCENNIPEEINNNSRFAGSITNEKSESVILMVYPNPTNGTLYVKNNTKDCIFEIYDVIGKKIMSQKLNETETKVDVSSLNNGTYLYKILQNNNLIKADKLILKN